MWLGWTWLMARVKIRWQGCWKVAGGIKDFRISYTFKGYGHNVCKVILNKNSIYIRFKLNSQHLSFIVLISRGFFKFFIARDYVLLKRYSISIVLIWSNFNSKLKLFPHSDYFYSIFIDFLSSTLLCCVIDELPRENELAHYSHFLKTVECLSFNKPVPPLTVLSPPQLTFLWRAQVYRDKSFKEGCAML